jgi:hypothetical protein
MADVRQTPSSSLPSITGGVSNFGIFTGSSFRAYTDPEEGSGICLVDDGGTGSLVAGNDASSFCEVAGLTFVAGVELVTSDTWASAFVKQKVAKATIRAGRTLFIKELRLYIITPEKMNFLSKLSANLRVNGSEV